MKQSEVLLDKQGQVGDVPFVRDGAKLLKVNGCFAVRTKGPFLSCPSCPAPCQVRPCLSGWLLRAAVVVAALLLPLMALAPLAGCTTLEHLPRTEPEPPYVSPYNFDNLSERNGHLVYDLNGQPASRWGIDVSSHQHVIDWQAVAAEGVEFAFIRVAYRGSTEGGLFADEQFEANYTGATAAGIAVGAYVFSQAISEAEAQQEAEFALQLLAGRPLAYPLVYDFEPVADPAGRANQLSNEQRTANALTFNAVVKAAGYKPMLYGNAKDINRFDRSLVEASEVWFAEYNASRPSARFDFVIWQYSNEGRLPGIDTTVDFDLHLLP